MQLLIGMSISRYLPATGTAGLLRCNVKGYSRVPRPPPRIKLRTSNIAPHRFRGRGRSAGHSGQRESNYAKGEALQSEKSSFPAQVYPGTTYLPHFPSLDPVGVTLMKIVRLLLIGLAFTLIAADPPAPSTDKPADTGKEDARKIQGSWELVGIETDGKVDEVKSGAGFRWQFGPTTIQE